MESLLNNTVQEDLETPVTLLGGMEDNLEVSDEEKRAAEITERRKFKSLSVIERQRAAARGTEIYNH